MNQRNASNNPIISGNIGEDIEALKRALIKVSFAGSGVDKRLDSALEKLRSLIKKNGDSAAITAQVEAITELLRVLGDESERLQKRLSGFSADELLTALLAQNPSAALRSALKTIDGNQTELQPFASQLMAIIKQQQSREQERDSSASAAATPEGSGGSFMTRLFSAKKTSAIAPSTSAKASLNIDEAVAQELVEPLLRLMDKLELPESQRAELTQLRVQMYALTDLTELPNLLENLSALVLDASDAEQAQFEAFLLQINNRLASVEEFLGAQNSRGQQSLHETQQLNKEVRADIQSIQTESGTAADLEQLQARVRTRLDSIVQRVDRFSDNQLQRNKQDEDELKRVREQLRATESEADQLREALREQRSRAATDSLTQIANRHGYHDRLQQEFTRWKRYQGKLSLVVCDIDHFKRVNDKHGHAAGDSVLRHVSQLLRAGLRETDFIARFGGEEFVLLMPETSLIDATKATNKLRQRVQATGVTVNGFNVNVTCSFGVAEFETEDVPRDVFERADKALYRAKNKGRNQVCCERQGASGDES